MSLLDDDDSPLETARPAPAESFTPDLLSFSDEHIHTPHLSTFLNAPLRPSNTGVASDDEFGDFAEPEKEETDTDTAKQKEPSPFPEFDDFAEPTETINTAKQGKPDVFSELGDLTLHSGPRPLSNSTQNGISLPQKHVTITKEISEPKDPLSDAADQLLCWISSAHTTQGSTNNALSDEGHLLTAERATQVLDELIDGVRSAPDSTYTGKRTLLERKTDLADVLVGRQRGSNRNPKSITAEVLYRTVWEYPAESLTTDQKVPGGDLVAAYLRLAARSTESSSSSN